MYMKFISLKKDSKGIALITVMGLMAILFLLGTAALTNTATESKSNQNYVRSVQAFYDAEAGLAEAIAQIKNNTDTRDQWQQSTDDALFQYQYYIHYDPNDRIYEITSEGHDPQQKANRRLVTEVRRSFCAADIPSPVYCETGSTHGQPSTIKGDSTCPTWADDSDPNNDNSVPCVSTPNPQVSSTSPIDIDTSHLTTSNPDEIDYDVPEIDLVSLAEYYRTLPPDRTSIPTGGTASVGAPDDLQVVYIEGDQTISGNKDGYGILIINGDLHLSGQLSWFGIVIVLGNVRQTGGGSHGIQATGAVLTPNDFDMRGNPDVQWCGDLVRKVIDETGSPPMQILSWKED